MTAPPTLAELQAQLACIKREVARRERAYPRQVDAGGLTTHQALYELTVMRGVACTLRGLIEGFQLPLFSFSEQAQVWPH